MIRFICALLPLILLMLSLICRKQRQLNGIVADLSDKLKDQCLSLNNMFIDNPNITNYRNTAQGLFGELCDRHIQTETDAIIILWHAQIAIAIAKYQTAKTQELYDNIKKHIVAYDEKHSCLPHNIIYCRELQKNIQAEYDNFQKQIALMQLLCDMHELSLKNVISHYVSVLHASES